MWKTRLKEYGQKGLPMGLRLFLLLTLFLSSIIFGVLLILFTAGIFKSGL